MRACRLLTFSFPGLHEYFLFDVKRFKFWFVSQYLRLELAEYKLDTSCRPVHELICWLFCFHFRVKDFCFHQLDSVTCNNFYFTSQWLQIFPFHSFLTLSFKIFFPKKTFSVSLMFGKLCMFDYAWTLGSFGIKTRCKLL